MRLYRQLSANVPEIKAKEKIYRQSHVVQAKAYMKKYRQTSKHKARKKYLRTPEVSTKRKVTRKKLGFILPLNLKLIDLKTGTLKKELTRKERKELGWVGNFFAPGIAVGGLGAYVASKGGKR